MDKLMALATKLEKAAQEGQGYYVEQGGTREVIDHPALTQALREGVQLYYGPKAEAAGEYPPQIVSVRSRSRGFDRASGKDIVDVAVFMNTDDIAPMQQWVQTNMANLTEQAGLPEPDRQALRITVYESPADYVPPEAGREAPRRRPGGRRGTYRHREQPASTPVPGSEGFKVQESKMTPVGQVQRDAQGNITAVLMRDPRAPGGLTWIQMSQAKGMLPPAWLKWLEEQGTAPGPEGGAAVTVPGKPQPKMRESGASAKHQAMMKLAARIEKLAAEGPCDECGTHSITLVEMGNQLICESCYAKHALLEN